MSFIKKNLGAIITVSVIIILAACAFVEAYTNGTPL